MKKIASVLIMIVLLFFVIQPASKVSGNEPNDTMGTADPIILHEVHKGIISSASDVDWYAFTPGETAMVQFSLGSPANRNYNVDVYDEAGEEIASGARSANKTDMVHLQAMKNRTYYFKVYGAGGAYDAVKEYGFRLHRIGYETTTDYEYDTRGNLVKRVTIASGYSEGEPEAHGVFDGQQRITLSNVSANLTAGGKNTVEFWMYWDGSANVIPFGWNSAYSIFIGSDSIGFTTGMGDLYGFAAQSLQNRWVFVSAVFVNGVPNSSAVSIYVNGQKQVLNQRFGTTTLSFSATGTAYAGGFGANQNYKFKGKLGGLRIWNRELTESEIQNHMHRVILGDEPGLVARWMTDS